LNLTIPLVQSQGFTPNTYKNWLSFEWKSTILLNKDVIAVDQDALGIQAKRTYHEGSVDILIKPLKDGSRAVAIFNMGDKAETIKLAPKDVGFDKSAAKYVVRDLWSHVDSKGDGAIEAQVPSHGTLMYRVRAE
jgi:alpha-galactosidase